MSEHVPTGRLTGNFACRAGSFAIPVNRVQRRAWGRHSISEYAPSARLIASIACDDYNFHIPFIRVALRRRCCARHMEIVRAASHALCEHLLSGKLISSGACRIHSFHIPIIRVSPSAGAHRASTFCASICFLTN